MNETVRDGIMVAALVITFVTAGVLWWRMLNNLIVGIIEKDLAESRKVWENKNADEYNKDEEKEKNQVSKGDLR